MCSRCVRSLNASVEFTGSVPSYGWRPARRPSITRAEWSCHQAMWASRSLPVQSSIAGSSSRSSGTCSIAPATYGSAPPCPQNEDGIAGRRAEREDVSKLVTRHRDHDPGSQERDAGGHRPPASLQLPCWSDQEVARQSSLSRFRSHLLVRLAPDVPDGQPVDPRRGG